MSEITVMSQSPTVTVLEQGALIITALERAGIVTTVGAVGPPGSPGPTGPANTVTVKASQVGAVAGSVKVERLPAGSTLWTPTASSTTGTLTLTASPVVVDVLTSSGNGTGRALLSNGTLYEYSEAGQTVVPNGPFGSNPADLILDWDAETLTGFTDGGLVGTLGAAGTVQATATGTLRALYRPTGIGGRPALEFTGSQGYVTPNVDLSSTPTLSLFIVAQTSSGTVLVEQGLGTGAEGTPFTLFCSGGIPELGYQNINGSGTQLTFSSRVGGGTGGTPFRLAGTLDRLNNLIEIYTRGAQSTNPSDPFAVSGNFSNQPVWLGVRAQGHYFLTGMIARVVLMKGIQSATVRANFDSYVFNKYGAGI